MKERERICMPRRAVEKISRFHGSGRTFEEGRRIYVYTVDWKSSSTCSEIDNSLGEAYVRKSFFFVGEGEELLFYHQEREKR